MQETPTAQAVMQRRPTSAVRGVQAGPPTVLGRPGKVAAGHLIGDARPGWPGRPGWGLGSPRWAGIRTSTQVVVRGWGFVLSGKAVGVGQMCSRLAARIVLLLTIGATMFSARAAAGVFLARCWPPRVAPAPTAAPTSAAAVLRAGGAGAGAGASDAGHDRSRNLAAQLRIAFGMRDMILIATIIKTMQLNRAMTALLWVMKTRLTISPKRMVTVM